MSDKKNGRMPYLCNCVDWPTKHVDELRRMIDEAKEVTYGTVRKNAVNEDFEAICAELGYALKHGQVLTMRRDWGVRYYVSKVFGQKCVFFTQSAIEYVFTNAKFPLESK